MKKLISLIAFVLTGTMVWGQTQVPTNSNSPIYYKDGKVGIGTTNPIKKLHIYEPLGANGDVYVAAKIGYAISALNKNRTAEIELGSNEDINGTWGGKNWGLQVFSNNSWGDKSDFFIRRGNNKYFTIKSDGSVGIGINNPDGKLHVNGGIAIQNPKFGYDNRGDAGERAGIIFGTNHPTNNSMFWICPDASIGNRLNIGTGLRYDDTKSLFTIENSGNVGIGTTTPSTKLDVVGTIRAEEIRVEEIATTSLNIKGGLVANNITVKANGNTADFVFEDDYQLKDLTEVENYIKTNKHLPDIKSAKEMEKEGVNLAEMNKLLLQKVEELTIYTIKQEKQLKEKDEKIDKMEERLAKIEEMLAK